MKTIFAFMAVLALGSSCGGNDINEDDNPSLPNISRWTQEIKPILNYSCALSGCHAGAQFLDNPMAFRASKAKTKILAGDMPKPGSKGADAFSEDDRVKVITYLGG